ncbi:hypothetical protein MGN01_33990 [Methylobacterium gnaphalii]|uniref:Uncharacterized protein n=1 Tax=Methylobacterium gnaphalii TaxID=1010610 RepID=A0A512JNM0_9HYPH|nr:hypothetical protein MGN01_33990 [Methylobacterium gnaphalii]GLS48801.1 hypothetical protein GCM10007885_16460 [Methylobacterium gnaphalii]
MGQGWGPATFVSGSCITVEPGDGKSFAKFLHCDGSVQPPTQLQLRRFEAEPAQATARYRAAA